MRDREIYRFGEYIGQIFVVIGGVAALALPMFQAPYCWTNNAVYLSFVLSALLSTIARLLAYRRGFQLAISFARPLHAVFQYNPS